MIRLGIVDHNKQLSNIFTSLVKKHPEIRIGRTYTDPQEALNASPHMNIDILAISTTLPEDGAWELMHLINKTKSSSDTCLTPSILVVGSRESQEEVMRYIEAGAMGYIRKTDPLEELSATMHCMYNGEAKVSPDLAQALMARLWELANRLNLNPTNRAILINLTPREDEILQLLKQNLSNQEIAEMLSIEVGTVKNHVHNILEKLGVNNRKQAAEHVLDDQSRAYRRGYPTNWASPD